MRNVYKILAGKPRPLDHSEDLGVDRRKILKWSLDKYNGKVWTGFIWLGVGTSGGLL
jgi:hypothetical protein